MTTPDLLPVARPLLPTADALLPYLRRIDTARWYSNFGPLCERFAYELETHLCVPNGTLILVSNATVGLALALAETARPDGRYCLVPAWTFVATAHAVHEAGYDPFFVDVDPQTWALTPDLARAALARVPGPVAGVMPVAPFGAPFDIAAWDRFAEETGIPVVVDAAAAFDTLRPGRSPAVVSLQATKVLGVGEGGFVVCSDRALALRIRQAANFGFLGRREAEIPGTNGKMSEYHAAVGLAALGAWPETRRRLLGVAGAYAETLSRIPGVTLQPGFGRDWTSMTCIVAFDAPVQAAVAEALAAAGIETRAWWGVGPWAQPAFRERPRTAVTVTERLAERTLGLPFAVDLDRCAVDRVGAALDVALTRHAARAFAR